MSPGRVQKADDMHGDWPGHGRINHANGGFDLFPGQYGKWDVGIELTHFNPMFCMTEKRQINIKEHSVWGR